MSDSSNGYERCAGAFIRSRDRQIGTAEVSAWAHEFPPGAEILELGCGHGVISRVLVETGLTLFAVDASPSLLREFHNHFPGVDGDSSSVEKSKFFGRTFDGVVAWGLLFLLDAEAQTTLLAKIAGALRPGGRLLFTAPREAADWTDLLTGELSHSLGVAEYERQLRALGLAVSSGITDEGGNHYYCATKPAQRQ